MQTQREREWGGRKENMTMVVGMELKGEGGGEVEAVVMVAVVVVSVRGNGRRKETRHATSVRKQRASPSTNVHPPTPPPHTKRQRGKKETRNEDIV